MLSSRRFGGTDTHTHREDLAGTCCWSY